MAKNTPEVLHRLEITGSLDRRTVEALQLEIRRLAKRYGAEITEFRIETVDESVSSEEDEASA